MSLRLVFTDRGSIYILSFLNSIDFDKVLSLGGEHARNLAIHIRNPFWKYVVISWADISVKK